MAPQSKEKSEAESKLFREVNNLRKGGGPEVDQDAKDRAKLNDSVFGKLCANKKFEYTTLAVIMLNAGFIGYDADFSARMHKPENLYDCSGYDPADCYQFPVFENFFAVYFTAEVIIRFFGYKEKKMGASDAWFVFDSTLVLFMVVETWVLPIIGASGPLAQLSVLRLLRLLRITRMAKLMRFFPELQIIVKGMVAAVRSVMCTAVLLMGILYVWSILFTSEFHSGDLTDEEIAGTAQELFGNMGRSMRHLFIMGTILDDITLCCNYIRSTDKMATMLSCFIIFVLISSFTMLNMLIGILCEVVCATGEGERNKNSEANVRDSITALFQKMDSDNNGEITREEFISMKRDKNVMTALKELEVKAKHFEMYADLMFKPEEEGGQMPTLDFEKTISVLMRLRPGTKVSALDFASFQMTVYKNHDRLRKHMTTIEKMTSMLTGQDLGAGSSPPSRCDPNKQELVEEPSEKVSMSTLPQLEKTSEQEILVELQRRLGLTSNAAFGKENVRPEAAQILKDDRPAHCLPRLVADPAGCALATDSRNWSKETYQC